MLALGRLCCFVIGKRQNTGLVGCDWKTAILVWSVVLLGGWFMAFALHTSRVLGICVLFPMKGQSPAVCFKILAIYFFLCVFLDEIICIIACYWEMLSQAYPRLILPRTRKQIFFLDKRLLTVFCRQTTGVQNIYRLSVTTNPIRFCHVPCKQLCQFVF